MKTDKTVFRYESVVEQLRAAYDSSAEWRDRQEKAEWKLAERAAFLQLLKAENRERLLEIGAGSGQDSLFFSEAGLDVLATDLSPMMVERCRAKGLNARVADVLNLGVPLASFEAVYAMNCLLHVPDSDLTGALTAVREVLRSRRCLLPRRVRRSLVRRDRPRLA